jgi:plasmid stabilization system protein ParE
MPTAYQLTPRALSDLDDLWNYIAEDSVEAANRVESAILAACDSLARHPLLGSKRSEITPLPVRFWTVSRFPNFIVVYRPDTNPLQVIAVLHGKRNIRAVLGAPAAS